MPNRTRSRRSLIRSYILVAGLIGALSALVTAQRATQTPAGVAAPFGRPPVSGVMSAADYERALSLQSRFDGKALDVVDSPPWLNSGRFWYRKTARGGNAFVIVDPASLKKEPAFDHARLAASL